MKDPTTINEWADFWRYEIGVNIIPADTRNKTTYLSWKEYQEKPVPEDLHNHWKETKEFDRGMAVIVGKVFHNKERSNLYLFCIDCDNQKAIDVAAPSREEIINDTLCEFHDDQPHKMHIYGYSSYPIPKKSSDSVHKEFVSKIDANEIPALEVKGSGKHGIMFCAPSIHKNGSFYHTGPCLKPKLMNGIEKKIDKICKRFGIQYLDRENESGIPIEELVDGNISIPEGHNRHLAILRLAEHFVATIPNLTNTELRRRVMERNQTICTPPLPDREIDKLLEQAIKFVTDTYGVPKVEQANERITLHVRVANKIMEDYEFVALADTKEILFYHNGYYKKGADNIISKNARKIEANIRKSDINEVLYYIQDIKGYINRDEFDSDPYTINVKNGLVDLRTGELRPHDPEYLSKIQVPINYNPEAKPPMKFLNFLKSCHDDDPRKVKTLVEIMSLCLIRNNTMGKAFLNTGKGSNGKSVYLEFLAALLGKENVTRHSIHDIAQNRFAMADLSDSLANVCTDIESTELKLTGNLKKCITGDGIQAEKKYQNAFSFDVKSKMIFSANELPEVYDESDGFYRRWQIVEWNNRFYGKKRDYTLENLKKDRDELEGMLKIMITNAVILLKTNHLTYESSVTETRSTWKEKADSVEIFINNKLTKDVESYETVQAVYERYLKHCKANESIPYTHQTVNKKMKLRGFEYGQKRIKGEVTRIWKGCKILEHTL